MDVAGLAAGQAEVRDLAARPNLVAYMAPTLVAPQASYYTL